MQQQWLINNSSQLNMFPSSGSLDCVTACGTMHPRCWWPVSNIVGALYHKL